MRVTRSFLAEIQRPRVYGWEFPYGSLEPLMPWITPEVPQRLKEIFLQKGLELCFRTGENVYGRRFRLDHMSLILQGIAGRSYGNYAAQDKKTMAIAIPGRIAGGNHTFYSHRPGVGTYFALTPLKVRILSNALIRYLMEEETEFRHQMEIHLECLMQSDRMGLAVNSMLSVRRRIAFFFLTWAFPYGILIKASEKIWVKYRAMLPVPVIAQIISASPIHVQREINRFKGEGLMLHERHTTFVAKEVLDIVWEWLRLNEEAEFKRCESWTYYLE